MKRLMPLAAFFFILSCTSRSKIPGNVIPLDSMENVLRDVIMADQFAQVYLLKDSLLKDSLSRKRNVKIETLQLYDEAFKIHHVSKESFKASLEYYASRPDLTKIMLDSLSARGSREKSAFYKRATPIVPTKKADSLRKKMDSIKRASNSK